MQGDLEQEQLDAAEALVSAGQDLTELECQKDTQSRRLEAQLEELTELHEKALESLESLTAELSELKTTEAERVGQVKELDTLYIYEVIYINTLLINI